jgi:hypothetical protein
LTARPAESGRVPVLALLITGPPGVGKTAVLAMLIDALVEDDVPHAAIEVEALAATHPEPTDEDRLRHLRAICGLYRRDGHTLLLLTESVATDEDLARLLDATGADERFVVRLEALRRRWRGASSSASRRGCRDSTRSSPTPPSSPSACPHWPASISCSAPTASTPETWRRASARRARPGSAARSPLPVTGRRRSTGATPAVCGRGVRPCERMRIELLYFDGCPSHKAFRPRLQQLIAQASVKATVEQRRVESDAAAQSERFLGSPTLRVDGDDVDPGAARRSDYGLKCRLYPTDDGLRRAPPDAWVLGALARAAGAS